MALSMSKLLAGGGIRTDFNQEELVDTNTMEWSKGPFTGTQIKILDRIVGSDHAPCVTALCKFDAGCVTPEYMNENGDDMLVLDGTYSDDTGDYPAGMYIRDQRTSAHISRSREGCVIFAKWNWIAKTDMNSKMIKKNIMDASAEWTTAADGHKFQTLYKSEHTGETVVIHLLEPNTSSKWHEPKAGVEAFCLDGSCSIIDSETDMELCKIKAGVWHRYSLSQAGRHLKFKAGAEGYRVMVRTGYAGHLPL